MIPTDENKNTVLLYMNDGYLVKGTIRDFAEKMEVYPSIVAQLDPEEKESFILESVSTLSLLIRKRTKI